MAHVSRPLPDEMLRRHDPPKGAHESFQESWGFAWCDPIQGAGGINHISIQRLRGHADVFNWIAVGGEVVGKYQHLNLPHPEKDFPDWELGRMKITTESDRRCRIELDHERASAELSFEGYTDPITFSLDVDGSSWGSAHYESIGRVTGTVTAGGEPIQVSGVGWQDHSWGPRRWADCLGHRWIMAGFGPELFMSVLQIITEAGPTPVPIGFVYDSGKLHGLERIEFNAEIADDGHSPSGCDAYIWTDAGHGYHVTGEVALSSVSSHFEGFWINDGLTTFECRGRLGAGIFETQELNRPTSWHRDVLGLDLPDALPAPRMAETA
jgi:hypothetical protein